MKLYTISAAARYLGITRQAIHKAIGRGTIKAKKQPYSSMWLIKESELSKYK